MKLRSMFSFLGAVSIALALVIGAILFFSVQATNRATGERQVLHDLLMGVFDLNLLTQDYVLNPGERARMQWQSQYELMSSLIQTYREISRDSLAHFESIQANYGEIGALFHQLSTEDFLGQNNGLTSVQDTLIGQLLVRTQALKTDASQLFRAKNREVEAVRSRTNFLVLTFVVVTALLISLNTMILYSLIMSPLRKLQAGTRRIAAGDLSHRVPVKGFTEFRELNTSFNEMSILLEKESAQRAQVQEELQHTLEKLEDRVRDRTADLEQANAALHQEMGLRQQREEEIKTERNRLFALFNNLPAFVYLVDPTHRITFINKAFRDWFGDPDGKTCHEILHCESDSCPSCHIDEVFEKGTILTREFTASNGRSYQVYDYPFSEADGTPLVLKLGIDITERKTAEQELLRREQQYKALVENAPDVISRFNGGYSYLYVNPAIAALTGKKPQHYLGRTLSEVGYPRELVEKMQEHIDKVMTTGRIQTFEHELAGASEVKNFHMLMAPESTREGQVETVLAITRDVTQMKELEHQIRLAHDAMERRVRERTTDLIEANRALRKEISERRRMEGALAQSEAKFRLTFDQSPIGAALVGMDYTFQRVNDSLLAITGYSREELLGRKFMDITHPDDIGDDLSRAEQLKQGEVDQYKMDKRYIHRKGHHIWVRLSASVMRDNKNRPLNFLAMVEDITERKQAEVALRQRELQYRALVENAPDIIARIDREYRVLYINPAVEKVTGTMPEEYTGKCLEELSLDESILTKLEQAFANVFDTGREVSIEHTFQSQEGKTLFFLTRFTPESTREGRVETILSITHDITHLKQLEQELREANRAKSEFLANMSHELRTPISGILGIAEVDLTREVPQDLREDLSMIRQSATSLIHIINDLLDLSRIEARKLELFPVDFHPKEMLENLVSGYQNQARTKDIELRVNIGTNVPETVHGDPDRLAQVIKNLLTNAFKFTERGQIVVSLTRVDKGGFPCTLRFSVSDTGIGIPEKRQKDLFQSFTQLEPFLSKKHGGAGLGLVISKQLVEMMNGSITVKSQPGKGSTFTFTVLMDRPTGELQTREPQEGLRKLSDISPLKILLVEDNMVNRAFLTRFLEQSGHRVTAATNGIDALEKLKKDRFDLILMDIQMPEMNGLEATEKIRSSPDQGWDPKIPIIALTAYAMKGDRERFLTAGMNDYVTKPVDFDILSKAILDTMGS
ncbi:MAG: PAS domain S-box protein [Desulfovibrionales bacterium]